MFVGRLRICLVLSVVAAGIAAVPSSAVASYPDQHDEQRLEVDGSDSASATGAQRLTSRECRNGTAGPYPCENVDLESFVPLPLLGVGTGNDIWGWTDPKTDRDYAIVGTATSTGFVDVTNPERPRVVGRLATRGTPDFILWRDIKVDGHYAFIVSEVSGSALQVFDLRRLRNGSPATLFTSDAVYDEFSYAHNIAINKKTDYAYVVGSDTCENDEEAGGLHMIDISRPENPTFAGCAVVEDADGDDETESNNYVHDVQCVVYRGPDAEYRGREVCFGSNENVVAIYDVTNKKRPRVLSLTGYPTAAYTHQGWLTRDQEYFLFGDELDEGVASDPTAEPTVDSTTTYIMRARDLDGPADPKPYSHRTQAIDHNLYTHEGRVYESNYAAGLRILDYTDGSLSRGRLNEVGFFDVFPPSDVNEFVGTWSNYPYFDSGIVVVSAIENQTSGLFVLRPQLKARPSALCQGEEITHSGTGGDDRIRGTAGVDVIRARPGDDVIRARGGNDVICANEDEDTVRAGGGDDYVSGGRGDDDDRLRGGAGDDEIRAQRGEDVLGGGGGSDFLLGNRQDDLLLGGKGPDRLLGNKGDDELRGGPGRDTVRGGAGRDTRRQ